MITKIKYYFSLVKFQHTVFALPFALFGFFLAIAHYNQIFEKKTFLLVLLCMVFARNAAMGFNRYIDRDIDAKNPRTKFREIPVGKISPKASLFFVIINSILFISVTYLINNLSFFLSPVALFIILFYSYSKRFTGFAHVLLGLSLSIAPAGAFIAAGGFLSESVIFLSLMVLFWTAGFDIIYSLQDEKFDKDYGLYSLPSLFGRKKSLVISRILHIASIFSALVFGLFIGANWLFWIGFGFFVSLIIYQHTIVNSNDVARANDAFGIINSYAGILFCAPGIISLFI